VNTSRIVLTGIRAEGRRAGIWVAPLLVGARRRSEDLGVVVLLLERGHERGRGRHVD